MRAHLRTGIEAIWQAGKHLRRFPLGNRSETARKPLGNRLIPPPTIPSILPIKPERFPSGSRLLPVENAMTVDVGIKNGVPFGSIYAALVASMIF